MSTRSRFNLIVPVILMASLTSCASNQSRIRRNFDLAADDVRTEQNLQKALFARTPKGASWDDVITSFKASGMREMTRQNMREGYFYDPDYRGKYICCVVNGRGLRALGSGYQLGYFFDSDYDLIDITISEHNQFILSAP